MTKDDLLHTLYNLHTTGTNLVPLEIKQGKLSSKMVDDIIKTDDCIVDDNNKILSIAQRCKNKLSGSIELPCKRDFNIRDIYKGSYSDFCGEKVKLIPQYSPDMAKIVHFIPSTSDMGALFSIPPDRSPIFLPLYQDANESIIFEIEPRVSKKTAHAKYDKICSSVERHITDFIPDCDVKSPLRKFLNAVYPISICSLDEFCINSTEVQHITSHKKSEDYLSNSKKLRSAVCGHCAHEISFRVSKIKADGIKKDLIHGAFSEWYASEKIKTAGLSNTLWNTDIKFDDSTEIHVDAIGFNEKLIIIIECKRIYEDNKQFQNAISKLKDDKTFFENRYPDKDVVIGLMTNFRHNIVPQQIDFHINQNNFLDFDSVLKNYV